MNLYTNNAPRKIPPRSTMPPRRPRHRHFRPNPPHANHPLPPNPRLSTRIFPTKSLRSHHLRVRHHPPQRHRTLIPQHHLPRKAQAQRSTRPGSPQRPPTTIVNNRLPRTNPEGPPGNARSREYIPSRSNLRSRTSSELEVRADADRHLCHARVSTLARSYRLSAAPAGVTPMSSM